MTPTQQRYVHSPKVIRRNGAGFHQRCLVAGWKWPAIDQESGLPAIVAKRQPRSCGGRFDTRQSSHVFEQTLEEVAALILGRVFPLRERDIETRQMVIRKT